VATLRGSQDYKRREHRKPNKQSSGIKGRQMNGWKGRKGGKGKKKERRPGEGNNNDEPKRDPVMMYEG